MPSDGADDVRNSPRSKMRIWTPMSRNERWWLTIFYRETGKASPVKVGNGKLWFGGKLPPGSLAIAQFEIEREAASIEVFPGSIILAIVASDEPGIDEKFKATLSKIDEAELVRPSDILMVNDPALVAELAQGSEFLNKQTTERKRLL